MNTWKNRAPNSRGSPLFIEASSAGTNVLSAVNFISTMSPVPSWAAVMGNFSTGASVALSGIVATT